MTSIAVAFNYDGIDKDTRGKLTTLAGQIKRGKAGYAKAVLEIGAAIHEAHELLAGNGREGKFSGWIEAECGLERSSAYRYLNAFEAFNKCPTVGHFSAGAMYALSEKSAPEKARAAAIKRSEKGETITKAIAEEIIGEFTVEAKPPKPAKPKAEPARPAEPQEEDFAPAAESQDDPPGDGPCLRGGDHDFKDGDCSKCCEPQPKPFTGKPSGGAHFRPEEFDAAYKPPKNGAAKPEWSDKPIDDEYRGIVRAIDAWADRMRGIYSDRAENVGGGKAGVAQAKLGWAVERCHDVINDAYVTFKAWRDAK